MSNGTKRFLNTIFIFPSTTSQLMSCMHLWVSLFPWLPLNPIPEWGKEQFQLLQNWMRLWPQRLLFFMRMDQRKLANVARICIMSLFRHFFLSFLPSWSSKLDRVFNIGARRCKQFPHCQYSHHVIRLHGYSSAKLRWKCIFHFSTGVSLPYLLSTSRKILLPTRALSMTAIFWHLIFPSHKRLLLKLIRAKLLTI